MIKERRRHPLVVWLFRRGWLWYVAFAFIMQGVTLRPPYLLVDVMGDVAPWLFIATGVACVLTAIFIQSVMVRAVSAAMIAFCCFGRAAALLLDGNVGGDGLAWPPFFGWTGYGMVLIVCWMKVLPPIGQHLEIVVPPEHDERRF